MKHNFWITIWLVDLSLLVKEEGRCWTLDSIQQSNSWGCGLIPGRGRGYSPKIPIWLCATQQDFGNPNLEQVSILEMFPRMGYDSNLKYLQIINTHYQHLFYFDWGPNLEIQVAHTHPKYTRVTPFTLHPLPEPQRHSIFLKFLHRKVNSIIAFVQMGFCWQTNKQEPSWPRVWVQMLMTYLGPGLVLHHNVQLTVQTCLLPLDVSPSFLFSAV